MKKSIEKIKKNRNTLFLVFNLLLSLLTMSLVLLVITRMIGNDTNNVSLFLGFALVSEVLHQVLAFCVYKGFKDRLRIVIVGFVFLIAAILGFLARENYVLFYLSTFLCTVALALNQFLTITKEKNKRGVLTSALLGSVFVALGIATLVSMREQHSIYIPLVTSLLLLFTSVKRILLPSLKYEKVMLFLDILVKTHTFDVLICLLAFIIAFSFMFPMVEDNITNFWDAVWYCFTVVTTIGFGDFYATSVIGRILTVILGIYGIVVVAILTSVIVNFYTEVSAKERNKTKDYIE